MREPDGGRGMCRDTSRLRTYDKNDKNEREVHDV
jgi:hypothetical protein